MPEKTFPPKKFGVLAFFLCCVVRKRSKNHVLAEKTEKRVFFSGCQNQENAKIAKKSHFLFF